MFDAKRLHPVAAVVDSIKKLKELLIPFAAFLFLGTSQFDSGLAFFIFMAGGLLFILVSGILSWFRFTYRLEDGEFRLEYGVFFRVKRYIPLERIQSVDMKEGILHRIFGLVQMKIETAGGGAGSEETEVALSAISRVEAAILEEAISIGKKAAGKITGGETGEGAAEIVYRLSKTNLLLMASTSGGAGVVISAVLAFFFQFEDFIPYKKVFQGFESVVSNGVVFVSFLVFLGLFFSWIAAILGMMLKYGNYTIEKTGSDLIISRGLLERRKITIPMKRIQTVQIIQNPLRELLGCASVHIESAGGSLMERDRSRVLLLPIIKVGRIGEAIGILLPEYTYGMEIAPLPSRALTRYIFRSLLISLPAAAVIAYFFQPWGNLAFLLPAAALLWAYSRFRAAGWGLDGDQLCLRYRSFSKTILFLRKNKIQSLRLKESYFQRRKRLARIDAYAKSGAGLAGGGVQDLDADDAMSIYRWFSRDEKDPNNGF